MQQKIKEIIHQHPKHYSKIIKNNPDLNSWVLNNSLVKSLVYAEMIYSAITQQNNVCDKNKIKKFKSIADGFGFCGPMSVCECAKQSVSLKVSEIKQHYSNEKRSRINKKREQTSLEKYGVTNNGQTPTALKHHKKYYDKLERKEKPITLTYYQKLNKKFKQTNNVIFLTTENEYFGVSGQQYYDFLCLTCNSTFSDYIDNGHSPVCKICNPTNPLYVSNQEKDVVEFIRSITDKLVIQNDKKIINPYELDIVIPDLKLAIEYCGLYWHSEIYKSKNSYHLDKMKLCNSKGYRLITIFEDEWTQKTEIVKNRLRNLLQESTRIYARKCQVKEVSFADAKQFINQTHIQGNAIFKIAYGCYYQTELVAIMTFGKPRYDKNTDFELIRYSSKGTVVGGASRLFKHFCNNYKPTSVISYCDMRWGTGNLYSTLGFTNITPKLKPSYAYTDFVNRYHRSNYTKQQLIKEGYDANMTEHAIMNSRKMYKIWDCGHSKWEYRS